jgi:hypothetical protein
MQARYWPSFPKRILTFVELMDASIAEAGPDHPAHVRLISRRLIGNQLSRHSCIVAESDWFESYWHAGFYEFMRWTSQVLSVAILIHFAPNYRRVWKALGHALRAREMGILSFLGRPATQHGLVTLSSDDEPRDPRLTWRQTKLEWRLSPCKPKLEHQFGIASVFDEVDRH